MQFGTQTAVYAEKLLVHDRSQRQSAEGIHARIVHLLGIFVLTLELKGEVIGQVPAFVVSAKQP